METALHFVEALRLGGGSPDLGARTEQNLGILANIRGDLTIHDDSGAIDVNGVSGNVSIEDDSGEITVKNVSRFPDGNSCFKAR